MANDESTDTAFEREDKQVSDGNANCQRDSDVLMINHLREALAKENADAEKWSWECQRIEKERDEAKAACAESAVEIKRLRHEVVDRIVKCEQLTKERDEERESLAEELHENIELFALLGLNSKEDFGHDTSTKVLRMRIEALLKERDEAKAACAEMRQQLIESRPLRADLHSDDPWCKCPRCHALSLEHGKGWLSPEKRLTALNALKYCADFVQHKPYGTQFELWRVEEAIKLLETE